MAPILGVHVREMYPSKKKNYHFEYNNRPNSCVKKQGKTKCENQELRIVKLEFFFVDEKKT